MAGDKSRGGGLLDDDVYDVLAVEVACLAQEGFLSLVVVFFNEYEITWIVSVRVQWNWLRKCPACEGTFQVAVPGMCLPA